MFPYKILVNSSRQIVFHKSDGLELFELKTTALSTGTWYSVVVQRIGKAISIYVNGVLDVTGTDPFFGNYTGTNHLSREQDCGSRSDLYIGSSYNGTRGMPAELQYFHIFDRSLTTNEILNLHENVGWFGNYCGNVFYNLGLVVFTHPKIVNQQLTSLSTNSTVTLREVEVYCTVGPGEYTTTHNRSVHYWNPTHNAMEIDARYTGSLFRPYITTIGLYNDKNELLAVGKLSTPIQTSRTTDTTFVLRYDY